MYHRPFTASVAPPQPQSDAGLRGRLCFEHAFALGKPGPKRPACRVRHNSRCPTLKGKRQSAPGGSDSGQASKPGRQCCLCPPCAGPFPRPALSLYYSGFEGALLCRTTPSSAKRGAGGGRSAVLSAFSRPPSTGPCLPPATPANGCARQSALHAKLPGRPKPPPRLPAALRRRRPQASWS